MKEVSKEVYSESNLDNGDIESATDLNHCRDSLSTLVNTFVSEGSKKVDKVTKAQAVVEQAKRLMGDNVKKMIDNQKDFNVNFFHSKQFRKW